MSKVSTTHWAKIICGLSIGKRQQVQFIRESFQTFCSTYTNASYTTVAAQKAGCVLFALPVAGISYTVSVAEHGVPG
jgi:hypothetical protein